MPLITVSFIVVLVYHNIVLSQEEKVNDEDALTSDEFDEQMKYLKENGYTSISLDDFYNWKGGQADIPEKSVIITFDDGYYSFKYLAQPILQKYNYKAACFLIGKVTMQNTPEYVEGQYGTIGLDEVKNKSENITYGSHTFYLHEQTSDGRPIVKTKSYEEIKEDTNIVDLLVNYNVCSSKREAREFVTGGTISINGEKVTDLEKVITNKDSIENKYVILRRGKKKYYLFEF